MYGNHSRTTTLKSGYEVKRTDIPEYFKDTEAIMAINFFQKYKDFGFAYSGGFFEQLNLHIEIIQLLKGLDVTYKNLPMTI